MADSLIPPLIQSFSTGDRYGYAGVTPELAMREQGLNRKQQIANLLMQRGLTPRQGQMAGRFYVAPSPVQGLADLASVAAGAFGTHVLDQQRKDLSAQDKAMLAEAVQGYQKATAPQSVELAGPGAPVSTGIEPGQGFTPQELGAPGATRPTMRDEIADLYAKRSPAFFQEGPRPTTEIPATPEARRNAMVELMANQHPQAQALGKLLAQQDVMQQERDATRDFQRSEGELNREARLQGQEIQLNQALMMGLITKEQKDQMLAQQKQLADQHDKTLKEVAKIGASSKVEAAEVRAGATAGKPMPATALRMQQEELDAIGAVGSINADLSAIQKQVESGKLQLGPIENLLSKGKNVAGFSTENSRNFASFKATLEKQRNESLRLNKGVQTEGDSIRAWNELLENINDPAVVTQRLTEIQKLNERAAGIRKMNVDVIRQNYGKEPLETEGYANQPAAIGQGGGSVAPFNDAEKERRYQEWKKSHK